MVDYLEDDRSTLIDSRHPLDLIADVGEGRTLIGSVLITITPMMGRSMGWRDAELESTVSFPFSFFVDGGSEDFGFLYLYSASLQGSNLMSVVDNRRKLWLDENQIQKNSRKIRRQTHPGGDETNAGVAQ